MRNLWLFGLLLAAPLTATAQEPASDLTIKGVQAPAPARMLGQIPVYDKFDALAPQLNLHNDTTYVINFWATWCKPCVQEMPYFEQLHQAYRNQKVKVLLVSLDFARQLESKLVPFVAERNIQSQVIALTDNNYNTWIDQVSSQWSGAIPITIVRKGPHKHLILQELGDYEELETIVKTFVNL